MVALVGGFGDGADRVGVADHAHPRRTVVELLRHVPAGTLTEGADDRCAGDEDFLPFFRLTPDTFGSYLKTLVTSVHGAELIELFEQQRALADHGVKRHGVTHFDEVDLSALQPHVDGAFHAGDPAAEDDYRVGDGLFVLVLIVDQDHVLTVKARDRWA